MAGVGGNLGAARSRRPLISPALRRNPWRRRGRPSDSTLVPPVRPFRMPPRTGIEDQMELSLDQALSMALANNKDIESSRIDRLESDYNLTAALGAFDPQMNINNYWEQQITPIASSLGGSATGSRAEQDLADRSRRHAAAALVWRLVQDGSVVGEFILQQHIPFAEPAISDVAQFLLHAAAVAQPAVRQQPSPDRRREEKSLPHATSSSGSA